VLEHPFKKVSVIGLGYIGLPTAAVLASRGVQVVGVDINQIAVSTINSGGVHIVEPGLDVVVQAVVKTGHLKAVLRPEPADVFVLAVPTPFKDNCAPDLSYVEASAKSIAPVVKKGDLIVLESTSPVGTTELVIEWLRELRPEILFPDPATRAPGDVFIAYCPERVLPGHVLRELTENDRVIGGVSKKCSEMARSFYQVFVEGECILSDSRTAEMVKLTENSFRDVNIAFANELSLICEKLNINVWDLIRLANRHPRVNILQPGPGVGGHCISVDPWFIVHKNPEEARLIRTARQVNDSKPKFVIDKIKEAAKNRGSKKVACLGLAFKADIDDLRESPAVDIVESLASEGGFQLSVAEPYIHALPERLSTLGHVELMSSESAIQRSDIVVLLTNHKVFYQLDMGLLGNKAVIDTRGVWTNR
jgi:UDP-N-acetyl-D-mannosaminuronic acid dehydrogenase